MHKFSGRFAVHPQGGKRSSVILILLLANLARCYEIFHIFATHIVTQMQLLKPHIMQLHVFMKNTIPLYRTAVNIERFSNFYFER